MEREALAQAIAQLNPAQKQAVETIYGPVLLLAGPGSGKTHVLTLRIANIIAEAAVEPDNILALTYTETAALNMRRRLAGLIGNAAYRIEINTFHGFCNSLIQQYRQVFPALAEFRQLDDLSKFNILQDLLNELDLSEIRSFNNDRIFRDLGGQISQLKKEGLRSPDFLKIIELHQQYFDANKEYGRTGKLKREWDSYEKRLRKNRELWQIYQGYEARLQTDGFYDYEDMINLVSERLRENEDFKQELQEKYQFCLVDEYQDTNGAQNNIVFELFAEQEQPNVFVVGDDDQAIYGFQGANVKNLLQFSQVFAEATIITTESNYRSRQEILDAASDLIGNNTERFSAQFAGGQFEKRLRAAGTVRTGGGELLEKAIGLAEFASEEEELAWLQAKIASLLESGVPAGEIAVIYRKHADARTLLERLRAAGVDVATSQNQQLTKTAGVRQLLKLFGWLAEPGTGRDLFAILHWPTWQLPQLELLRVVADYGQTAGDQLLQTLLEHASNSNFDPRWQEVLQTLSEMLTQALEADVEQLLLEVLERSGILAQAIAAKDLETILALQRLQKFIRHQQLTREHYRLADFLLDWQNLTRLNLQLQAAPLSIHATGVNFLTAHTAKGLEFNYVFIIRAVDHNWGNRKAVEQIRLLNLQDPSVELEASKVGALQNLEEERRLFFVALTRARAQIYLSYSQSYYDEYSDRYKGFQPSIFVEEVRGHSQVLAALKPNTDETVDEEARALELALASLQLYHPAPLLLERESEAYLRGLLGRFALSFSAYETYLECPRRFLYSKLLRAPKLYERALLLGSAVHSALELYGRQRLAEVGVELPELVANVETFLADKPISAALRAEIQEEAARLLTNYWEYLSSQFVDFRKVEYSFGKKIQLADVPVTGKLDALVNYEGELLILDYKTKAPLSLKSLAADEPNEEARRLQEQLAFYLLLAQADKQLREKPKGGAIAFVKPSATRKFITAKLNISHERQLELRDKLVEVYAQIQALDFERACGKKDCEICALLG